MGGKIDLDASCGQGLLRVQSLAQFSVQTQESWLSLGSERKWFKCGEDMAFPYWASRPIVVMEWSSLHVQRWKGVCSLESILKFNSASPVLLSQNAVQVVLLEGVLLSSFTAGYQHEVSESKFPLLAVLNPGTKCYWWMGCSTVPQFLGTKSKIRCQVQQKNHEDQENRKSNILAKCNYTLRGEISS
jgi:hypothetical protein